MAKSWRKLNQGTMAEAKLPHPSRHHIDQDLLISNYRGRSFNEFRFHNWISENHGGEGLTPEPEWNLFQVPGIAAEKLALLSLIIAIKQRQNASKWNCSSDFLILRCSFLIPVAHGFGNRHRRLDHLRAHGPRNRLEQVL